MVYVLAVNIDLQPRDTAPKTWAELANPKWSGQIAGARADGSVSAMSQLQSVLTVFAHESWDEYAKTAKTFVFTDGETILAKWRTAFGE